MTLGPILAQELDYEAKGARESISRLPEDRFGWQPHEKSMTALRLASHIAELSGWASRILASDELSLKSDEFTPWLADNRDQLLSVFDEKVREAIEALENATDEQLHANWRFIVDGNTLFEMPRVAVIRGMVIKHMVHHRAQLGVYLRLLDIPVPAIYGWSADEK